MIDKLFILLFLNVSDLDSELMVVQRHIYDRNIELLCEVVFPLGKIV